MRLSIQTRYTASIIGLIVAVTIAVSGLLLARFWTFAENVRRSHLSVTPLFDLRGV